MTHLITQINGQFIGTFRYNWNDAQAAGVTFEQIAELAWGRLTNDPTIQMRWQKLRDAINENPDFEIKLIIDQIRIAEGREPAIEELITETFPLYYSLTPARDTIDLLGNIVRKVRHLQIIRLTPDQVSQLQDIGYEVVQKSGLSLDAFLSTIEDPVAFFDKPSIIINSQPITLFGDGSTSPGNDGVFEQTEADLIQSAEDYIGQVKKEDAINEQIVINETPSVIPITQQAGTGGEGLGLVLLIAGLAVSA